MTTGKEIIKVYTIRDLYYSIKCFKQIIENIQKYETHTYNEKKVVKQIHDFVFNKIMETIIKHMGRCSKCNCNGLNRLNGFNMCDLCNRCNGLNIIILINRISIMYESGIDCCRDYIKMDNNSKLKNVNSYIFM